MYPVMYIHNCIALSGCIYIGAAIYAHVDSMEVDSFVGSPSRAS
jgi:hypothetical protein